MASYCFIGDSRFVGIQQTVAPKDVTFIAKVGEGNGYYSSNAGAIAGLDKNITIIYELGVNDLNSSACIANLKDLVIKGFKNIYFSTVTPVDEAKEKQYGYSVTNSQIEKYNSTVASGIPSSVKIINSYSYLKSNGFTTTDGLHYTADTYKKWYDYIVKSAGAGGSSSVSAAAAGGNKELTIDQLADAIADGLVVTGVEGPYKTCTKTSGQNDDYISIGCSCWEGTRANKVLNAIGLSQYTKEPFLDPKSGYTSYSKILQPISKGSSKTHQDLISETLDSEKGRSAQRAILSADTKNYVTAIKSAVPNITDARCIIYAGIWCPTSTSCVCSHLKKNVSAINDPVQLNNAFIVNNSYAAETAKVGSANYQGYYNRGNITLEYVLRITDGKIGDIDVATLNSIQQGMAADGSMSAGSASAASVSSHVKDNPAHATHYKHHDTVYAGPDKLFVEPIYPDLVTTNKELPGCEAQKIMANASESEVEQGPNMTYTIPQETMAKYSNPGYSSAIVSSSLEAEQKSKFFDRKSFASMFKVPSSGKPPVNEPFPIDEKIAEMERHAPRVRLYEIQCCPEARTVAQKLIELSMNVEKRICHLENNFATIMRYLMRMSAVTPINCIYYGGQSQSEKYKCIRCLKDNRLEDGGLVSIDQCLTCSRREPLIGQVYEILNDEGLNLSEVLDECQMSYTTPEEYLRFIEPTKRQDELAGAKLNASSVTTRNQEDAASDFSSAWTPESSINISWALTPLEDQVPSINGNFDTLESNANSFTNAGMPMAGAGAGSNILIRQKKLMDALPEDHILYPLVEKAKEWVESRGDGFVRNMNEYLFKNISSALSSKKSSFDAILVGAATCASGRDANSILTDLEASKSSLEAKDSIKSLLLITQFHNMSRDNLYGVSGNADDKTLPKRLDKVTKFVEDGSGGDSSDSGRTEVGFGLDWSKVNDWNWTEYAEPLNINITKNQDNPPMHESMELLPKIIYLYCLFLEKCTSSRYDDPVHGYIFPFRENDLRRIRYSADFYDQRSYGNHGGIDLATDSGTDILAISDGVIVHTESGAGAGNCIAIQHNDGMFSVYCHMQVLEHKMGEKITKGQVIGHVGHTGHCYPAGEDGSHLHLYICKYINGEGFRQGAVNPELYYTRLTGKIGQYLGS